MQRTIATLAALLLAGCAAQSASDPVLDKIVDQAGACAFDRAQSMSLTSDETAYVVAIAAVSGCGSQEAAYGQRIVAEGLAGYGLAEKFHQSLIEHATGIVIDRRAVHAAYHPSAAP